MKAKEIVQKSLDIALRWGGIDGGHHKAWVIDQMVRALTNCPIVRESAKDIHGTLYTYEVLGENEEYLKWVRDAKEGEDGPNTYDWDEGIAP